MDRYTTEIEAEFRPARISQSVRMDGRLSRIQIEFRPARISQSVRMLFFA